MAKQRVRGRALSIGLLGIFWAASLSGHAPTIILSTKYLNFVAAPGGPNPPAQIVSLGTNEHFYEWSAAVSSSSSWLKVSPASGSLAGNFQRVNLTVSVASTALSAGFYYGTITVSGLASPLPPDNTPQVIEVALTVTTTGQAAPGIAVSPGSLSFEGPAGSGRSYNLSIQVGNAGGGSLNWTAAATISEGGDWLSVVRQNASSAVVTATIGSLARGFYNGRVIVSAAGAVNSPRAIPVVLSVRDPFPASLRLSSSAIDFVTVVDSGSPPGKAIAISNGGDGNLNWIVDASTFTGGAWLTATPSSGSGSGAVTVAATLGSLSPGTHNGRLTITAEGALNSPAQVAVTFVVQPVRAIIENRGVVNAATFLPSSLAPGEIVSIFGSKLGPSEPTVSTLDPVSNKIPTTLAGTTVTFDGVPAPLYFVSNSQVNLQVPFEVANRTSARMVVNVGGQSPAELTVPITEAAPGVFTIDGARAAAVNQDSTLNTPDNPASVGSVVQLYLTGQGLLNPKVETGAAAPLEPPFPKPVLPVAVTIDALDAKVLFAGLAPGFVGLTQINVEIPRGAGPSNQVRVSVGLRFNQTPRPVFIAVR